MEFQEYLIVPYRLYWINKGDFNSEKNFQMTNILIYLKGKILKINIFS